MHTWNSLQQNDKNLASIMPESGKHENHVLYYEMGRDCSETGLRASL